MRLSRRRALYLLLASGVVVGGAPAVYLATRSEGMLGDANATDGASELGRWYLAQTPHENDPNFLCRAALSVDLAALETLSPQQIREKVVASSRADYLAGDVLHADGWVVSRAEARLGALIHVLHET